MSEESGNGVRKGNIRCPGCREETDPSIEFVPLDQVGVSKPKKKIYNLSVLMRMEHMSEDGHTVEQVTLFGHPAIVRASNQISGQSLLSMLSSLVRANNSSNPFEVVLTDASGKWCSRCLLAEKCRGCVRLSELNPEPFAASGGVLLQMGDSVAISIRRHSGQDIDDPLWNDIFKVVHYYFVKDAVNDPPSPIASPSRPTFSHRCGSLGSFQIFVDVGGLPGGLLSERTVRRFQSLVLPHVQEEPAGHQDAHHLEAARFPHCLHEEVRKTLIGSHTVILFLGLSL